MENKKEILEDIIFLIKHYAKANGVNITEVEMAAKLNISEQPFQEYLADTSIMPDELVASLRFAYRDVLSKYTNIHLMAQDIVYPPKDEERARRAARDLKKGEE